MEKLHKTPVLLYGSGRTDSGVHAVAQKANFFSPVDSIPVEKYASSLEGAENVPTFDKNDVEEYIRKSGGIIIAAKKCTNYAIGITTATLCEALNFSTNSLLTISTMMNGEYGISDVCLSTPTIVGGKGIQGHAVAPLTDSEIASLRHSAGCLKDVIKQIQF